MAQTATTDTVPMVTALVDSSIVIDVLRGHAPSVNWLGSSNEQLGLTRYTWLEIIQGCQNKQKQQLAVTVLEGFDLIPITNEDVEWAAAQLLKFRLKLQVDKIDCLIAATSFRLQLPLYTRNLKHFQPLLKDLAVAPY